jgi:ferric-dicitrate binding protein FerR (iron transport regulator)
VKWAAASQGGVLTINAQTASYTLVLTDAGKIVSVSNASANVLTVPTNATVAFAIGTSILIRQAGAGQTTVTPAGGVTVSSRGAALKLAGQYAYATLVKVATDTWELSGDITT